MTVNKSQHISVECRLCVKKVENRYIDNIKENEHQKVEIREGKKNESQTEWSKQKKEEKDNKIKIKKQAA